MKKIGIILDSKPYWGGGFQYSIMLLKALCNYATINKEIHVTIFAHVEEWKSILLEYVFFELVNLVSSRIVNASIIDGKQLDIVISSTQTDWSELLKTPMVSPIHDLMHFYESRFPEISENGEYDRRNMTSYSIVKTCVGVFVDSNVGKKHVCDLFGKIFIDKIYVLPFAAPLYLRENSSKIIVPFTKYFFYPAQFWEHKNHKGFIRAIAENKKRGICIKAVFSGSPKNAYQSVLNLISELNLNDDICILGYVDNSQMRYLYEHARALIMPDYLGPTNIPPVEAITLKCPVAVSDVYGAREQLEDAALYFDPEDDCSIEKAIRDLWIDDELCNKLIEKGQKIAYKFSQELFNDRFSAIFSSVTERMMMQSKYVDSIKDFLLPSKHIYIYGAGTYGIHTLSILKMLNYSVNAIVVSEIKDNREIGDFLGINVIEISSLNIDEEDRIICTVKVSSQKDVIERIEQYGGKSDNVFKIDFTKIEEIYSMMIKRNMRM